MASVQSSSVADAMANLHEDGFIFVKDAEAGDRVEEMETRSIPPASEQGLEFYRINVLDDPVCATISLTCVWYLFCPRGSEIC